MKLGGYSQKSIETYTSGAKSLYKYFRKPLNKINQQEFRDFLVNLSEKNYSSQTINQYHAALRLILTKIYKVPFDFDIPYAKRAKKLPVVLSGKEIKKILEQITNPKHKLMLAIMYASGLRVSEIVNLKVKNIDLETKTLTIQLGKGKKDRITIFPQNLLGVLQSLIKTKKASDLLFLSNRGGKLTTRTIQKIFNKALKKSGLKKTASCHCLRHSFATHLLENGVDIRYIQELLGHANLKTTQIYTKVAKHKLIQIKSPFDSL